MTAIQVVGAQAYLAGLSVFHESVEWRAAERSICRNCSAYGILEVTGARCRKCGHGWTIE